jgi:hypothetical protein
MDAMIDKIQIELENSKNPLSFVIIVPYWKNSEPIKKI